MKLFEDNYKPIEITVKNFKGKEFVLNSLFQTSENALKVENLMADETAKNTDKIIKMMIVLFGENDSFWKQFSIEMLAEIAEYVREEGKKKEEKTTG
jgi:hypothetical protein